MNTTTVIAEEIVSRHAHRAWARQFMARHYEQNGRFTKEKQRQREIAEAVADAMAALMDELREAGYTVTD